MVTFTKNRLAGFTHCVVAQRPDSQQSPRRWSIQISLGYILILTTVETAGEQDGYKPGVDLGTGSTHEIVEGFESGHCSHGLPKTKG